MNVENIGRALHVVVGSLGASGLMQAFDIDPDRFLVNNDPISCGPAPATADLSVWRDVRENYIRHMDSGWPDFSFAKHDAGGLLMNLDRLAKEDTVIIWASKTLPDQLTLAWVVFLFDNLGLDFSKLHFAQYEIPKADFRFRCLGEMPLDLLRELEPTFRVPDQREKKAARSAWDAYTSDDPRRLVEHLQSVGPLPGMHEAIQTLVYRYPDHRTGLTGWDEELLRSTDSRGPSAVRIVGHTLASTESLDRVGDPYLFRRFLDLGNPQLKSPLLSIKGGTTAMRFCEATLTPFGRAALEGEANNVAENGIDDWIGGVHLVTGKPVTYRVGMSLRTVQ